MSQLYNETSVYLYRYWQRQDADKCLHGARSGRREEETMVTKTKKTEVKKERSKEETRGDTTTMYIRSIVGPWASTRSVLVPGS